MKLDYAPPFSSDEFEKYEQNKYNIFKLKPFQCIVSHFESTHTINKRYPEIFNNLKFRLFSFIRDPLQTAISLYNYRKLKYPDNKEFDITIEEHLGKTTNYLASNLCCDEDNYKEVLGQYFFIGILEYAQISLDILAEKIKRPKIRFPHHNISKRNDEENNVFLDVKEEFYLNNKLDYEIYNYVKLKFGLNNES